MTSDIETRNYIAEDTDVAALTESIIAAREATAGGATTYLRMLAANTINALGAQPRARAAKAEKLSADTIKVHLEALEKTQEHFYKVVCDTIGEHIPKHAKGRAVEINRQSNFARTSVSALRNWIKDGNDVTTIVVAKLTKNQLAVATRVKRPPSVKLLVRRVERTSKRFIAAVLDLSENDKATAVKELRTLLSILTKQQSELTGAKPTTNASRAFEEGIPLIAKGMMFLPSETMVVRQQERPA
jgi:hypothetical protein